jgi:hypothetical protein
MSKCSAETPRAMKRVLGCRIAMENRESSPTLWKKGGQKKYKEYIEESIFGQHSKLERYLFIYSIGIYEGVCLKKSAEYKEFGREISLSRKKLGIEWYQYQWAQKDAFMAGPVEEERAAIAVCVYCGGLKHGSFNACEECGLQPFGERFLAESLYMSEHYFLDEGLQAFSEIIRNGDVPPFEEDVIEKLIGTIRQNADGFIVDGLLPHPDAENQMRPPLRWVLWRTLLLVGGTALDANNIPKGDPNGGHRIQLIFYIKKLFVIFLEAEQNRHNSLHISQSSRILNM